MAEPSTHVKRHGLAAAGVFVLAMTVSVFVVLFVGILFGFIAIMACCGGGKSDSGAYLIFGLLGSFAASSTASVYTFRWLRARHHARTGESN